MAQARVGRRLSAIVAADVAGYSRLMGLDEVGTARTLRERLSATEALVAKRMLQSCHWTPFGRQPQFETGRRKC
jgi:hypothetical protein